MNTIYLYGCTKPFGIYIPGDPLNYFEIRRGITVSTSFPDLSTSYTTVDAVF